MGSFLVDTLPRSYVATVERGALRRLGEFVPKNAGKVFIVSTPDVWELYGDSLGLKGCELLLFPGGEPRKRLAEVEALADQMACRGADRTSIVIAFGGGIVNDLGGFLASIFMRGVPVIQVPTTLLAQVDAAVGGKTGANLAAGKNLIGTFHQPLAVVIDPSVIDTLPEREYRAGLFEIVKHGIIGDRDLFEVMLQKQDDVFGHEPNIVDRMIADSVRLKAEVVSSDEKESGRRRILNFGHTFGHALEAETGYSRFLHGEAVGWGMLVATRLAVRIGLLATDDADHILACLAVYQAPDQIGGVNAEAIAVRLKGDKKTIQGRVHFVLPERVGQVLVSAEVPERAVMSAIRDSIAE